MVWTFLFLVVIPATLIFGLTLSLFSEYWVCIELYDLECRSDCSDEGALLMLLGRTTQAVATSHKWLENKDSNRIDSNFGIVCLLHRRRHRYLLLILEGLSMIAYSSRCGWLTCAILYSEVCGFVYEVYWAFYTKMCHPACDELFSNVMDLGLGCNDRNQVLMHQELCGKNIFDASMVLPLV